VLLPILAPEWRRIGERKILNGGACQADGVLLAQVLQAWGAVRRQAWGAVRQVVQLAMDGAQSAPPALVATDEDEESQCLLHLAAPPALVATAVGLD